MQWLIPFAAPPASEAGRQALAALRLPHLERLLGRWHAAARDDGEADSLSAPHERVLARALGWPVEDGRLPWAAHDAAAAGLDPQQPWGRLTPVHLALGSDHVGLTDPAELHLGAAEADALYDAVRPLFDSEGFVLHRTGAAHWLLSHPALAELPTLSLERAIGRAVHAELPEPPRLLRRVLNEVQMLLYTHEVNDRRETHGALPVNALWLSGCGVLPPGAASRAAALPRVDERLRAPALASDWAGWAEAWAALDTQVLAPLVDVADAALVLCGERSAVTLAPQPRRWWQDLFGARGKAPAALLESL